MRLIDRYLLRELLLPLGLCLGGFLTFWIAFDLFAELPSFQRDGLGWGDILQYYLLLVPQLLPLILPAALLLALLYALTQHARHHELTAMRAAGVSVWRLGAPYFAAGFVLSLALLAVNEGVTPRTDDLAEAVVSGRQDGRADAVNLGFVNAPARRDWHIPAFDLRTAEMRGPGLQVHWHAPEGEWWLFAGGARHENGAWTFTDVRTFHRPVNAGFQMPVTVTPELTMTNFTETPDAFRAEHRISSRLRAFRSRKTDVPAADLMEYFRRNPELTPRDNARLRTMLHGRLASPWTCLVVVLIALPFGARAGRRNMFVGVAGSIFIGFAYLFLKQSSLALGGGGLLPPWLAAWLPNAIFAAAGVWLIRRLR